MTPIHSAQRDREHNTTLPSLGQALSRETSPISMVLPPPMKRMPSDGAPEVDMSPA
jgi:zinc finger protein CreA/MIG